MPSVIAMISSMPASLGLEDRVGGEARRDEDHRRVGAGLVDRVVEGVEDRDALDVLAALAGRHAGHDVGAVARLLSVWNVPSRPVMPETHELACRCRRGSLMRRSRSPSPAPRPSRRRSCIVASVCTLGRSASASSARPSSSLVPSRRTTNGTVGLIWSNASIRPSRDLVAARDAAEDVEQHGLDLRRWRGSPRPPA